MQINPSLSLAQKLEIKQELKELLPKLGVAGTLKNLKYVLREVPQFDEGKVNYLIAGGWACDILSGNKRKHHDIDIIILEDDISYLDTDNNEPQDYFGILSTSTEDILQNHIIETFWKQGRRKVYVPSHEFLITTKIAPYQGNPSREKDLEDIVNLMKSKDSLDFYKLKSTFSKVPELEEPQRYALCVYKLYKCRNENEDILRS